MHAHQQNGHVVPAAGCHPLPCLSHSTPPTWGVWLTATEWSLVEGQNTVEGRGGAAAGADLWWRSLSRAIVRNSAGRRWWRAAQRTTSVNPKNREAPRWAKTCCNLQSG